MRFSTTIFVSALAALTNAQANPFTRTSYAGFAVGTTVNITWTPTSQSTVSLILVQGNPGALTTIGSIVSALPNQGYYLWTPASTIVKSSDYALEIIDDSNKYNTNYTPEFAIDSPLLASAAVSSSAATSAAVSASTSAPASVSVTAVSSPASSAVSGTTMVTATSGSKTSSGSASSSASQTANNSSASKAAAPTMGAAIGGAVLGLVGAVMVIL